MPYYDFKCHSCGKVSAQFRKINDRDSPPYCCGFRAVRQISAPSIRPEIPAYVSPASGKVINSRAQQREDLLRENCTINEPGLKRDIERRSAELKERDLVKIDASVDRMTAEMSASNLI